MKSLLLFTLSCLLSFTSLNTMAETVKNSADPLPIATNLQTLGQKALKQNIPIAILFTAKGLQSTENLKALGIYPALLSGQLDGHVLFTEIEVNTDAATLDFYGESMANKEYKALYNLNSLPVVVFVNGEGDVLTGKLLSGAYDFYHFYLKQSINKALKALNNSNLIAE